MNVAAIVIIVIVILIVVAIAGWALSQRRRSGDLRQRFGPEYERTVAQTWDQGRAESVLEQRVKRVEKLDVHPLSATDYARFSEAWRSVQSKFVDDPAAAVTQADRLIGEVMQTRGYPVGDFEQRAADISVEHPRVVENYRAAHEVAQRSVDGQASTEDLRKATIAYRSLFQELVEASESKQTEVQR